MVFECIIIFIIQISNSQQWVQILDPSFNRCTGRMAAGSYNDSIFILGGSDTYPSQLWEYTNGVFFDYGELALSPTTVNGWGDYYTQIDNLLYALTKDQMHVYNMQTNTFIPSWYTLPASWQSTSSACLTSTDNILFVIGGRYYSSTAYMLKLGTMEWIPLPLMHEQRTSLSCMADPKTSQLYAMGGREQINNSYMIDHPTIEKINISNITNITQQPWYILQDTLIEGVKRIRSIMLGDLIYIIGGIQSGPTGYSDDTVHTLNPMTDSVSLLPERLSFAMTDVAVTTLQNHIIYVFGGASPTASPTYIGCKLDISTAQPTGNPTFNPTIQPTNIPTYIPTINPTYVPTFIPTNIPTNIPTYNPTILPSYIPTQTPSYIPTYNPTSLPSYIPTTSPSYIPTYIPTSIPTQNPTRPPGSPTFSPTFMTDYPTFIPTNIPTINPSRLPTIQPTVNPTANPSFTYSPSIFPSNIPTISPVNDGNAGYKTTVEVTKSKGKSKYKNDNFMTFILDNILWLGIMVGIIIAFLIIICILWILVCKRKKQKKIKHKIDIINTSIQMEKVQSVEIMSETEPGEGTNGINTTQKLKQETDANITATGEINDAYSNKNTLKYWLNDIGMGEYLNIFVNEGFCDDIAQMEALLQLTNDHLKSMGIAKQAHRNLILAKIEKLNVSQSEPIQIAPINQIGKRNENDHLLDEEFEIGSDNIEPKLQSYNSEQLFDNENDENEEMYNTGATTMETKGGNDNNNDSESDDNDLYNQSTKQTKQ